VTSTDKVIQILTFLKEKLQISDEDLLAIGTQLGELQATASNETATSFQGPASLKEVQAFGTAAAALLPLDEEMRSRALAALQALLLPPEPTLIEKLAPALGPALAAVIAQAKAMPERSAPERSASERPSTVLWADEHPASANVVRIVHVIAPMFKETARFTRQDLSDFTGIPVDVILSDDPTDLPDMYVRE
jgi:hypothetical protein